MFQWARGLKAIVFAVIYKAIVLDIVTSFSLHAQQNKPKQWGNRKWFLKCTSSFTDIQSLAGLLAGSFYPWKWERDDSAMLFSMLHARFSKTSPELDVS